MSGLRVLVSALDPSNDEARRWLEDELRQSAYHSEPSWWERIGDAIGSWFDDLFDAIFDDSNGPASLAVAVIIALLILAGTTYLLTRMRRNKRARPADDADRAVLGKSTASASAYRDLATQALESGDYLLSVVNSMRAIAQEAVERTLLTRAAALTAHEIAYRLAALFPPLVNELLTGADTFDDVVYGGRPATRADAVLLQTLDRRCKATKPRFADDAAPPPSLPPIRVGTP